MLQRVLVRPQPHASFKPPTYLRINPRWKDVAAWISRERVKPAFAAAKQVDRLYQRQTPSRRTPTFKLLFEHGSRVPASLASVAGPSVAIRRRDVAAARAVVVIEPVAAEPVRAPKTAAKASAEVASGKMAAAKMSAATTACERNGGGCHHRCAEGKRRGNDN